VIQTAQTKEKIYFQRRTKGFFLKNWCLKRSKIIYAIVHRWMKGDVRINIAVECRENKDMDWGHAWVTCNGEPVFEPNSQVLSRAKTKIAESGKYIYWIYNSKSNGQFISDT
jgi:hypothetical protein